MGGWVGCMHFMQIIPSVCLQASVNKKVTLGMNFRSEGHCHPPSLWLMQTRLFLSILLLPRVFQKINSSHLFINLIFKLSGKCCPSLAIYY